jgi:cytochrome P450
MDYNPFLPEVQKNPFPYYAYLRQHAPVYQVPGVGFWAVSRYEDVLYAFKNPQVFSSTIWGLPFWATWIRFLPTPLPYCPTTPLTTRGCANWSIAPLPLDE